MSMRAAGAQLSQNQDFACQALKPAKLIPSLMDDAKSGLLRQPRSLSPKYFYDDRGSLLFDQICDTKEYYPTRIESQLLHQVAGSVIRTTRPDYVVELGSGTSRKTRFLFDACNAANLTPEYWPVDVCEAVLVETAQSLQQDYPWLSINAYVGDYHGGFEHLPSTGGKTLYVFLGGTIGNFEHEEAINLLTDIRRLMKPEDHILMGFDRVKEASILEAAYNDQAGVTAAFNLNLLRVLNRGLEADFQLDQFSHQAIYNEDDEQIEMYLVSESDQSVQLGALDEVLQVRQAERIRTEISRKFTPESIQALLSASGLQLVDHQQADQSFYSLVLAQAGD